MSFFTWCGTDFVVFAIAVESLSMVIAYMWAFYVVLETNMSIAKSFSIAFDLPSQRILQSCPSSNILLYSPRTLCNH